MTAAIETLSSALCPWLRGPFEQFERARGLGQLGHAWLISGAEGVGKINLALALAGRLLGNESPPAALDAGEALEAIARRHDAADRHPDLHWLFPEEDKETISVDQVRALLESLSLTAHGGAAKVVIIEPAEAMTTAAANALLKTLEQPTGDCYLLLISHRPGRLLATVRSRCQHLKLPAPAPAVLAQWLRVDLAAVTGAQSAMGQSPFGVARLLRTSSININEIEASIVAICEDRLDSQTVAQTWAKSDVEAPLTWLRACLYSELRERLAPGVSTGVTVPLAAALHNAWRGVASRTLFDLHDRAEKLLNQLGSGVNVELALQALLSTFQANRGRQ